MELKKLGKFLYNIKFKCANQKNGAKCTGIFYTLHRFYHLIFTLEFYVVQKFTFFLSL
jgi:hypothetical protein